MKEYDEVLQTLNINKQDGNDKLSTIDETSSLEYQVHWSFLLKYSILFISGSGMGRRNSSTENNTGQEKSRTKKLNHEFRTNMEPKSEHSGK